ncbi:venom protease-like [Palaemon carinicauda]|uniref:venom protease-like n=1 Tax=Palaemon carinicauda TaxID=392227 RepID=UPI0035B65892
MRVFGIALLFLSTSYAQDVLFPDQLGGGEESAVQQIDEDFFNGLNVTTRQNFNFPSFSSSGNCFTPAGERGICGHLSQCRQFIPLVQQLKDHSVQRFFRERICRLFLRTVHVCCPLGQAVLPVSNFAPGGFPNRPPQSSVIPSENECGIPGVPRVTGGVESQPGFWPWLAAVGQRILRNQFFVNCGGTLITQRHVITAAHCFGGPDDPNLVRLGEHHLDHDNAGERPQEFRIAGVRTNSYNRNTHENDIAIVIMDRPVTYNDFIRPACLPFNFQNEDFNGKSLTVVGWGRTSFENRATSKVPMQAQVPIVNRNTCFRAYQRLRNKPLVDDKVLCAGVGGQDSCNGDSGGPLNYLALPQGRFYLAGVVSFGVECARPDYPGVYTRVTKFLNWIQQNVQ